MNAQLTFSTVRARSIVDYLKTSIDTVESYCQPDGATVFDFYRFAIKVIERVLNRESTEDIEISKKHTIADVLSWVNMFFTAFAIPMRTVASFRGRDCVGPFVETLNCIASNALPDIEQKLRKMFDPTMYKFLNRNQTENVFGVPNPFMGLLDSFVRLAMALDETKTDNEFIIGFFGDYLGRFMYLNELIETNGYRRGPEAYHSKCYASKVIEWANRYASMEKMNGSFSISSNPDGFEIKWSPTLMTVSPYGKCIVLGCNNDVRSPSGSGIPITCKDHMNSVLTVIPAQNSGIGSKGSVPEQSPGIGHKESVLPATKLDIDRIVSDEFENRVGAIVDIVKSKVDRTFIESAIRDLLEGCETVNIVLDPKYRADIVREAVKRLNSEIVKSAGLDPVPYLFWSSKAIIQILINHPKFKSQERIGSIIETLKT